MKKRYVYIDNPRIKEMLDKFAKQDAQKRPNGKANMTATLYEILAAEQKRREAQEAQA